MSLIIQTIFGIVMTLLKQTNQLLLAQKYALLLHGYLAPIKVGYECNIHMDKSRKWFVQVPIPLLFSLYNIMA